MANLNLYIIRKDFQKFVQLFRKRQYESVDSFFQLIFLDISEQKIVKQSKLDKHLNQGFPKGKILIIWGAKILNFGDELILDILELQKKKDLRVYASNFETYSCRLKGKK